MGKLTLDEQNHWLDWITDAEVPEEGKLEWGMLENNEIEGFLPFEYVYVDNKLRFRYFYDDMRPITAIFRERQGDFEDCRVLLESVLEIIVRGQEYLLEDRGYLLQPEWIFWNRYEKHVAVCYLPGEQNNVVEDFIGLVEYLMKHMEHGSAATVEMVYGLYDVLHADGLQAEEALGLIKGFRAEDSEGQKKYFQDSEKDTGSIPGKAAIHTDYKHEREGKYLLKWAEDISMGRISQKLPEEINTLAVMEETTVGRSETNTCILPFLQISRRQAILSEENGRLYLTDTASRNGTWLNDVKLSPGEKMECLPGDRVRFANITYFIREK